MADETLINALLGRSETEPPVVERNSLEGARQRQNPVGWWGPKTSIDDAPYYLPASRVGELPYRYQGVAAHGGMALLPGGGYATLAKVLNALYAGGTIALGRTAPVKKVDDYISPPAYPPNLKE